MKAASHLVSHRSASHAYHKLFHHLTKLSFSPNLVVISTTYTEFGLSATSKFMQGFYEKFASCYILIISSPVVFCNNHLPTTQGAGVLALDIPKVTLTFYGDNVSDQFVHNSRESKDQPSLMLFLASCTSLNSVNRSLLKSKYLSITNFVRRITQLPQLFIPGHNHPKKPLLHAVERLATFSGAFFCGEMTLFSSPLIEINLNALFLSINCDHLLARTITFDPEVLSKVFTPPGNLCFAPQKTTGNCTKRKIKISELSQESKDSSVFDGDINESIQFFDSFCQLFYEVSAGLVFFSTELLESLNGEAEFKRSIALLNTLHNVPYLGIGSCNEVHFSSQFSIKNKSLLCTLIGR